jgi:CheY-like chemotaxis protein
VVGSSAAEVGTAASRGAELTRQLLTLGRRQPTDRHPLDLAQVVDEALVVLRRLLDPSIEIVAELPDDCSVMADRGMMNQVVMNLALNARDAMPSGGRLTIAVAPSGPEQVELIVADTGMGIDESSLSRVFEPFFTTKGHGTGSGVGLATVHGIVAQHGGTITVQSTPGSGARFCVALPRSEESAARPSDEHGEAGRARGLTVLVVDDAAPVRRVVARMLRSGGHRAMEAEHPEEALRLWEEAEKVDLVIADVTLSGGWDGPRLARELRDRDPDLSVVLVSGLAPDDRLLQQLPNSEFLQKPFTLAALNAVLARRFPA